MEADVRIIADFNFIKTIMVARNDTKCHQRGEVTSRYVFMVTYDQSTDRYGQRNHFQPMNINCLFLMTNHRPGNSTKVTHTCEEVESESEFSFGF